MTGLVRCVAHRNFVLRLEGFIHFVDFILFYLSIYYIFLFYFLSFVWCVLRSVIRICNPGLSWSLLVSWNSYFLP